MIDEVPLVIWCYKPGMCLHREFTVYEANEAGEILRPQDNPLCVLSVRAALFTNFKVTVNIYRWQ